MIQRSVKFAIILHSSILEDLLVWKFYIKGKMTKRPFTTKRYRANECLALVYNDVCGPFNIYEGWGYEYFITFTNDYSRLRSSISFSKPCD